jgi:hypothetical protein
MSCSERFSAIDGPAAYFFRAFAEFGGLLSCGNDLTDNYRRAPCYISQPPSWWK